MPVTIVMDDQQEKDPATGKPYRHENGKCARLVGYPASKVEEVRNTERLRKQTVRCPEPGDWDGPGGWIERENARLAKASTRGTASSSRATTGGKTTAKGAAPVAAQPTGDPKAKALADSTKAARLKRPTKESDKNTGKALAGASA